MKVLLKHRIESFSTSSSFKWFHLKFSVKHFETKVKKTLNSLDHVSRQLPCFYREFKVLYLLCSDFIWFNILASLIWRRRYYKRRDWSADRKCEWTGLAGFSSIPPVWYSFNILTKSVKFHPWFGCVEASALNPVKVFRMLQILYFLRQFLRIKTKITFFNTYINYKKKSTCIAQFQINFKGKSSLLTTFQLWKYYFLKALG